jgi:predicted cobalt transporter CbtA
VNVFTIMSVIAASDYPWGLSVAVAGYAFLTLSPILGLPDAASANSIKDVGIRFSVCLCTAAFPTS